MSRDPSELSLVSHLDTTAPQLRRELTFRPQSFAGETFYVVDDPVSTRFFRIGVSEYTFISLLDGNATIGEVLQATRQARPDCEFGSSDALAICQWVIRMGLAQDKSVDAITMTTNEVQTSSPRRTGGRVGPLSVQLPLFHPDRFFGRLRPWLGWCFSFPAFAVWVVVMGWAARDLAVHGERLSEATSGILSAENWIWLGLAWVILKLIHECGHAIACKRLGGEVREAGIIFILFAPLAYVDVTSSWRLRSKWARIQVAAAGMYVELLLAAVATFVWCRIDPGALAQVCFNVMITASVTTLLFNANPLMRFDGYYILSDFLELPNLYTLGQQYVGHVVRRHLFGLPSLLPGWTGVRAALIRVYGLASLVWRNMVFFSLVLTAATLMQGAGIVLSALAMLMWSGAMVRRLVRFAGGDTIKARNWMRFAVVGGGGGLAMVAMLAAIPWPAAVTAPAVVRYAPHTVVRAGSDGFIREIHVCGGQVVGQGDVLVVMDNEELIHELAELKVAIEESRLKRRIDQRQGELALAQAETEELRTLERRYVEKKDDVDQLVVRAPRAGMVIGRNLDTLAGAYLPKGSDILSIGNESEKEVRLTIAQEDVHDFRNRTGGTLRAYLTGRNELEAPLSKIEPRASVVPIDPSLCAPDGGALAVRAVDDEQGVPRGTKYELLSPRFTGVMPLDAAQSKTVFSGQRARVALRPHETVGRRLFRAISDWIDRRTAGRT